MDLSLIVLIAALTVFIILGMFLGTVGGADHASSSR